jgi:hypothetical protein
MSKKSDLSGNELEVVLAEQNATIYFTKTHVADLKKVLEVDDAMDTAAAQPD